MKTLRYTLLALPLAALLAVAVCAPCFAAWPFSPAAEPTTLAPQPRASLTQTAAQTEPTTEPTTQAATQATTVGVVPIMEAVQEDILLGLEVEPTPLEYIEANALPLAALAAAGLALLLSAIALAKTKKKSSRRRMKNYF